MGGRYIGAYFFIPLDKRPETDDALFAKLGVQSNNWFGPMILADRHVTVLSDHVCVQLYFLANSLFHLRNKGSEKIADDDDPLDEDAGLPFAYALRDGAVAAGADVLILETHLAELERILHRYSMVVRGDVTGLARQWFGLLYLSDKLVSDWEPAPDVLDRDELPGGPGRTLFASRGWQRFY